MLYSPETDSFDEFRGEGLPLGVIPDGRYPMFSRPALKLGEIVLLGTDGIWEARAPDGSMFGKDRVREVIRRNAHAPARDIIRALLDAVGRVQGKRPPDRRRDHGGGQARCGHRSTGCGTLELLPGTHFPFDEGAQGRI